MSGAVRSAGPGEHVCLAADPTNPGAARERVVCVVAPPRQAGFLDWLETCGIASREAVATGRLLLLSPEEGHLADGVFDPDQSAAALGTLVDHALAEGFDGVRPLGWAADAVEVVGGADALLRLESCGERVSRTRPLSILCVYDRDVFGSDLTAFVTVHPRAVEDRTVSARVGSGHVTLVGEVDLANVDLLRGTLAGTEHASGDVVADLGHLAFIDLGGARELLALARHLAHPRALRLLNAPRQLPLLLDVVGWDREANLVVECRRGAP